MRHRPIPVSLIIFVAFIALVFGTILHAQNAGTVPPGKHATGTSVEQHGPYGLALPYPEESNVYQVPAFDTQGGARVLLEVELVVTTMGDAEARFGAGANGANAGQFAAEPWVLVMIEASATGGVFEAEPTWDPMGYVVSPDIPPDAETAWFTASFDSSEAQSIAGDLSMWLDPDGFVDLVVHEIGAVTGHGSGNGSISVGAAFREGNLTVNYIWTEGDGSAAPAPAPVVRRPRDLTAAFCDALDRKVASGQVMAPNTTVTFGGK